MARWVCIGAGWMVGAILLAVLQPPRPAAACSPLPSNLELEDEEIRATADGAFVVKATLQESRFQDVVVRDADGEERPGSSSSVLLWRHEETEQYTDHVLIAWRPDEPLEPNSSYAVELLYLGLMDEHSAEATMTTGSESYAGPTTEPDIRDLEARRVRRTRERCDGSDSECGCESYCVQYTEVRADLPAPGGDRFVAFGLEPVDGFEPARIWRSWDAAGTSNRPRFLVRTRADEYCVVARMYDLHGGSVVESEPTCVADSGEPEPSCEDDEPDGEEGSDEGEGAASDGGVGDAGDGGAPTADGGAPREEHASGSGRGGSGCAVTGLGREKTVAVPILFAVALVSYRRAARRRVGGRHSARGRMRMPREPG